jgi:hypothetical protein
MRKIKEGQKVICSESGVIGVVLKFYCPTACEEQTMVQTEDGREYHAPTRTWIPYTDGLNPKEIYCDELCHIGIDMGNGADMSARININPNKDPIREDIINILGKVLERKDKIINR